NRLLFAVERRDRHYRSEDFLLQDAALAREAGDDGWLDEIAGAIDAAAAGDDRPALGPSQIDIAQHLLQMRLADQRADVGALLQGIADAQAFRGFHKPLDELLVDRSLHEDA